MPQHNIQTELEQAAFTTTVSMFETPEGRLFGAGTTVGNDIEGWAPGAFFIDTDAASGLQQWVNTGTVTAASWAEIAVADVAGGFTMNASANIQLGTSLTTAFTMGSDGSNVEVLPLQDQGGSFHFGDGTTDADVKIFMGSVTEYAEFDVSEARFLLAGAQNNRMVLGELVTGTPTEVGALSGNFLGLQMAFQNAGATLGRLTGMQIDVDDTSVGTNTIACSRFYSEKVSGVGGHEHWGIMAQSTVTAGKVANTSAGMFINIIKGTSAVGSDGGSHRASAIVGEFDMASTADIATSPDAITGTILAYQIGNNVNSAAKLKSTCIFGAVLGGDSAVSATGAFFKCIRKNSISASKADYGLDMYYDEAGAYLANSFAVADIRMANAVTISSGTGAPSASLPEGSLYTRSDGENNARLYIATDGSGTWVAIPLGE